MPLTQIPQAVTASRMGRKPIKPGVLMKPLTYYFDPQAMARVEAMVGKKKMSEFIRAAIERELAHREGQEAESAPAKARSRKPSPSSSDR